MHQSTLTRECNFGDVGIHSNYRKMIKNATWYLGGYTSLETLSDGSTSTDYYGSALSTIYERERSNEWLLTPLSDTNSDVVRINYSGYASPNASNLGREVRPVLYLNENVYVIEVTGTITDPYIIGM